MKKTVMIFIFIFLTGLFAGLFFCTGISAENSSELSKLMISGLADDSSGFISSFFSALTSNLLPVLLMLPAVLTHFLRMLPAAVLWFKSFALGFCCSLVYASDAANPLLISLLRLLPQNLFYIPSIIVLSIIIYTLSARRGAQKNRPHANRANGRKGLLFNLLPANDSTTVPAAAAALCCILMGALMEAVFRSAAL
ncbi:MAG: stage II sporulation protein M [Bacillota bacterium]|nr:stage II sporulation protein M [Bacillota bacterium]